jgi:oxidoreductase
VGEAKLWTSNVKMQSFNAIIAGSTGATGREIVLHLLKDPTCQRVTAITRRPIPEQEWEKTWPGINIEEAKSKLHIAELNWEGLLSASNNKAFTGEHQEIFRNQDWAVWALGSTRKDAGSAEAFKHIDLEFMGAFANAVKELSGAKHFSQISSQGASASSWFLYPKTKGQADELAMSSFPSVSVFRPGLLGRKEKARGVEKLAAIVAPVMPTDRLGLGVVNDFKQRWAAQRFDSKSILSNSDINKLAAGQ